ncbi:MAG: hypothetical protein EBY15_11900 [Gammaproteobacteria bacterium]|nr:hypothetical protein [Gammaproteobacteria bacterium]
MTERLLFIVTVQVPDPWQAPDQPIKFCPTSTEALKLTGVPWVKEAVQAEPQLMPEGLLVTTPLPERVTVRVY